MLKVDVYLKVFRANFDKVGQIDHYGMMMGDAFVEELLVVVPALSTPNSISEQPTP